MDIHAVGIALLDGKLTDSFQEGQTLVVTNGAADFHDGHLSVIRFGVQTDFILNHIGDMRNHLDSGTRIHAISFILNNLIINLSGGYVAVFVQALINKTFIMANIQICLATVFGHKHLAMLIRVHSTWINIQIRI